MDFKKNQKGFSLIEMVVVVAIIALIAGVAIRITGYLSVANAEKTVQYLQKACNKLQAVSMSKMNKTYLYIYKASDGQYYYTFSTTDCDSYESSVMKKDGEPIGKGMTIYSTVGPDASESDTEVTGSTFIKIAYKKDGTFDTTNTTCDKVKIVSKGNSTAKLLLVKASGKAIIK